MTAIAARSDLKELFNKEAPDDGVSSVVDADGENTGNSLFDGLRCSVNGRNSVMNVSCFGNDRNQHFIFLPSIAPRTFTLG